MGRRSFTIGLKSLRIKSQYAKYSHSMEIYIHMYNMYVVTILCQLDELFASETSNFDYDSDRDGCTRTWRNEKEELVGLG